MNTIKKLFFSALIFSTSYGANETNSEVEDPNAAAVAIAAQALNKAFPSLDDEAPKKSILETIAEAFQALSLGSK